MRSRRLTQKGRENPTDGTSEYLPGTKDPARPGSEAIEIANDTLYRLGAGVWTRDGDRAFGVGRAIKAGNPGA